MLLILITRSALEAIVSHRYETEYPRAYNATTMTNLNDILAFLEEGLFGLTLYLAPDFFYNPANGVVLPLFHPIVKTSLETNHLDVPSQIALCVFGATILTGFLSRLFLCKTPKQRTLLAKMKLLSGLAKLPVWVHVAWINPDDIFAQNVWIAMIFFKITSLLLQLRDTAHWANNNNNNNNNKSPIYS
jgi:hypothetical protein